MLCLQIVTYSISWCFVFSKQNTVKLETLYFKSHPAIRSGGEVRRLSERVNFVCPQGICRGIDVEKRLYHILTPVPPEELRNVNCLLVGAISIPHCVLKNQVSVAPGAVLEVDGRKRGPEIGARITET